MRISQYFEPYERSSGNAEVELDLFNDTKQVDLKGETGFDMSTLASTDLASLKTKVDDLNVGKPKVIQRNLRQLSNEVDRQ